MQAAVVAEEDGIDCEVIDLRTLLPWDRDAVGESSTALRGLTHAELFELKNSCQR
jgi:pyruvate/2-oxoglutarate/acetoin dehydrogenase E1 component